MLTRLKKLLAAKKAKIGVVGLGYVGLPLAVLFAKKGFAVSGIDVDSKKCERLNRGVSYILDVPSADVCSIVRNGLFKAYTDYAVVRELDAVIICVPTPLNKVKAPDISFVVSAVEEITRHLKRGALVVLESTTYPGTTEEEVLPRFKRLGFSAEKDFFLAFSPERVDPGNKRFTTDDIPKVVGGIGPRSGQAAQALYGSVMRQIVPVSSAKCAEMTKLLENTFRSVNIGLINEMALLCHKLGIDIWEVVGAAKTKPFGFMAFYPGPGIGGHCLPIDPLYLSWKSRAHGFVARMIELAARVNQAMPLRVVERVQALLAARGKKINRAQILVLGAAYKRDIDDARESPAIDVMHHLIEKKCRVSYSDRYVDSIQIGRNHFRSRPVSPALLKKQDCVMILTDHHHFDYAMVAKHARLILDTRNVMRKFSPRKNLYFL